MAHQADELLTTAQRMNGSGLNRGRAGNLSVRIPGSGDFLVTPTGMAYDVCVADDMVRVAPGGEFSGRRLPSSEWRFHHDIYRERSDAGAVLHAHAPFATALACQRRDVPSFHYMVARFGGSDVRCAAYATFGTQALSDAVLAALDGRSACLMAHHGMLVVGRNLEHALDLAIELETLCEHYWRALQLGEPPRLDSDEMMRVLACFAGYGQQS